MGIYNRDYMRPNRRDEPRKEQAPYRLKKTPSTLTWWEQLRFTLWRWLRRKK